MKTCYNKSNHERKERNAKMTSFEQVLQKYRDTSISERHKGYRFERLMQSFLKTYPIYEGEFSDIWLWDEFPSSADFGVGDKDLGIDLVAKTRTKGCGKKPLDIAD